MPLAAETAGKWHLFCGESCALPALSSERWCWVDVTHPANGIGHLTRVFGTKPVTAAEGVQRVSDLQRTVVESSRLGIPAIVHEEGCPQPCAGEHRTAGVGRLHPAAV